MKIALPFVFPWELRTAMKGVHSLLQLCINQAATVDFGHARPKFARLEWFKLKRDCSRELIHCEFNGVRTGIVFMCIHLIPLKMNIYISQWLFHVMGFLPCIHVDFNILKKSIPAWMMASQNVFFLRDEMPRRQYFDEERDVQKCRIFAIRIFAWSSLANATALDDDSLWSLELPVVYDGNFTYHIP